MTDEKSRPRKERRGQGSGAVYQRASDGRWMAYIDLGWIDGKRKRKYFSGHSEAEVIEKLNKALGDQAQGKLIPTGKQTVSEFLTYWLEHVVQPSVRPRTYDSYESTVRMHLIPTIGRHRLDKLSPQHVTAMLNAKRQTDLSVSSILNIRNVLRAALNQAMKWELVGRNVATLVTPPKKEAFEAKPLSAAEAERFLAAARGSRLEALYSVAVALGLRQGEALGLSWDDVNLDTGVMMIRRQLQWLRREKPPVATLTQPKSKSGRRTLPIPAPVLADLKRHLQRQYEDRVLAGDRWKGEEWNLVFCSTIGTPLDPSNVTKDYKGLLTAAGLDERRYHDLRHSCGSFLTAKGVQPRVIMQILGHSQIATTMNIYAHVDLEAMKGATDLTADLFSLKSDPPERSRLKTRLKIRRKESS